MTCRESLALGAYVLGALEPAECSVVERHAARCADCRAELLEMAALVGMLQRLPFEELRQVAEDGSARTVPVGTARAASRVVRRAKARRALIACVLAAAAAFSGVGVYLGSRAPQPAAAPSAVTFSATDPATGVTGSAALTPDPTGTSISLRLSGLPPAVCRLVVHARDGHTETAAGWTARYDTAVSVPASSSLGVRDIARMDVVTGSGHLLVELRPR